MKKSTKLFLILSYIFALSVSCSSYRKTEGTLNEKITKAQYSSFSEYRNQKKQWERVSKKTGKDICIECLLFEKFRMYRDSSFFFNNVKEGDTIYIIEDASPPYNNYLLTIWNRTDTVSFYGISSEKTLNKTSEKNFSKYEIQLVGQWNIKKIREEEKKGSVNILGGGTRYVTKIIVKNNKYKINCIKFKQFCLFGRDK